MFETPFTIVGNIVTDPIHRQVGEQEMVRFRVASNSRRRTVEGTWEPGNSLFVTVTCWGRVVEGASAALVKGDPVIVVGRLQIREWEKEGRRGATAAIDASALLTYRAAWQRDRGVKVTKEAAMAKMTRR